MVDQKHKQSSMAAITHEMQLRTRKEHHFDEMEAQLPSPKTSSIPTTVLSVGGDLLSKLGRLNPLSRAVTSDDIVWLFDNTAFRPHRFGSWQAEFVASVFEREPKCAVVDVVSGIAKAVGLADDAQELKTIEERLLPFLWDLRPAKAIKVTHGEKALKLGPTGFNGISSNMVKLPDGESGLEVDSIVSAPNGTTGLLQARTYFAGPDGWAILSDVDDTIKITQTSDPVGILRKTFVDEPTPIPGMPELYRHVVSLLPRDTPWFYLSASPYNLYPFLREFRDRYYPPGTIILRDSSWKTIAGLLSALTVGTEEYKTDRIRKVHDWLPKRKLILIGDSTQSDPEAYGDIYREFPGWVKLILIRKATDIAAVGIEAKNEPARFEKAFEDVAREDWHVFEDPTECSSIIEQTIQRG